MARDAQFWGLAFAPAAWAGLILAALLIFQQSMRLCRVRTAHILRIWSCSSLVTALPIAFVGFVASYGLTLSDWGWWRDNVYAVVATLALTMLVCVTWALRCGYRYYVRMPHAGAVAICAQLIALLAFITIDLVWGLIDPNHAGILRPFLIAV